MYLLIFANTLLTLSPVDLSSVYLSAFLTSEYRHLPTTGSVITLVPDSETDVNHHIASGRLPEMDNLLDTFNISGAPKDCPYFEGYFGEHVSQHPGVEQRAGSFQHLCTCIPLQPSESLTYDILATLGRDFDRNEIRAYVARAAMDMEASAHSFYADAVRQEKRTKSSAVTRIKKRFPAVSILPTPTSSSIAAPLIVGSAPVARPLITSTSAGMPADVSFSTARFSPNSRETAILSKIRRGTGISSYEFQDLLEQCGVCKKYFTGSVLCRHIFHCSRD